MRDPSRHLGDSLSLMPGRGEIGVARRAAPRGGGRAIRAPAGEHHGIGIPRWHDDQAEIGHPPDDRPQCGLVPAVRRRHRREGGTHLVHERAPLPERPVWSSTFFNSAAMMPYRVGGRGSAHRNPPTHSRRPNV